jgi:hypothetical protein
VSLDNLLPLVLGEKERDKEFAEIIIVIIFKGEEAGHEGRLVGRATQ